MHFLHFSITLSNLTSHLRFPKSELHFFSRKFVVGRHQTSRKRASLCPLSGPIIEPSSPRTLAGLEISKKTVSKVAPWHLLERHLIKRQFIYQMVYHSPHVWLRIWLKNSLFGKWYYILLKNNCTVVGSIWRGMPWCPPQMTFDQKTVYSHQWCIISLMTRWTFKGGTMTFLQKTYDE